MLDSVASKPELAELLTLTKTEQILRLAQINVELEQLSAQERVKGFGKSGWRVCGILKLWYPSRCHASSCDSRKT